MLKIKGLRKTFHPDSNPLNDKKALQGIDLTLNDGDFLTIIGGNGSGKTTLLNLIAGVYIPDGGSISLDDKDLLKLPEHKRAALIGRVFQDPKQGTIGDISLFENLAIADERNKRPTPFKWALTKEKKQRYIDLLAPLGLGLENRLEAKMSTFSGGQRQSVTLLMATLSKPSLLLLDEHTAALDPKTAKTVMSFTEKIVQSEKISTLMITHNMKDAIRYGNRLIMMDQGKIIFEASGKEKEKLTVEELLKKFQQVSQDELPDSMILA